MERVQRRSIRRFRRRIRRVSRFLAPILLLLLAAALSLGVVRVMERGPGLGFDEEAKPDRFARPASFMTPANENPGLDLEIDASPDLVHPDPTELIRGAMPASVLEVEWPTPEPKLDLLPPVESPGPLGPLPKLSPESETPLGNILRRQELRLVPEPRTSLLLAGGLAWLGARRPA